jgi:succinate dehydrogenase/fumarate reductase flavoprotein subunit
VRPYDEAEAEKIRMRWLRPMTQESGENIYPIRDEIENLMWENVGLVRTGNKIKEAIGRLDALLEKAGRASVENRSIRQYNMEWNNIIDVINLITVSRMVAASALYREESRGGHYREDFPKTDNSDWLINICQKRKDETGIELTQKPVVLNRLKREEIEKVR